MSQVIQWAEKPATFAFPDDPGPILAAADELGLNELFESAAEKICGSIRLNGKATTSLQQSLDTLADHLRYRLLDRADTTTFQILREIVPPYAHQYRQQLEKLLPNSHFARLHHIGTAHETYEEIIATRSNASAHLKTGVYQLDVHARVDKGEISWNCRHLFTLERIRHRVVLWDRLRRPYMWAAVYDNVIDAVFGPQGFLFTLELDGYVYGRSMLEGTVARLYCGGADALSASKDYLLAFTTTGAPHHCTRTSPRASLWKWSPTVQKLDAEFLHDSVTASISPNSKFIMHNSRNVVTTTSLDTERTEYFQTWDQADGSGDTALGDVITFLVSNDSSIVAAVYVCGVKFWWRRDAAVTAQYFDLERRYLESFGHAAFSPDSHSIALGSWEGRVILLGLQDGTLDVSSRFDLGHDILHLAWSPDGQSLLVSSYSGCIEIDPHHEKFALLKFRRRDRKLPSV